MLRVELILAPVMGVLLALTLGHIASAGSNDEALSQALEVGRQQQERLAPSITDTTAHGDAKRASEHRNALEEASAMQAQQQRRARALLETLARGRDLTQPPATAPMPLPTSMGDPADTQRKERLVIFVSSGMPEASMRRLLEDARRADALVVFRGLVGDDFTAMAQYLSELLGLDEKNRIQVRAVIEPRLFKRLGIGRVPVVAVAPDGLCLDRCPEGADSGVRLVAGDVSLAHALRHLAKAHRPLQPVLQPYLNRLEDARS